MPLQQCQGALRLDTLQHCPHLQYAPDPVLTPPHSRLTCLARVSAALFGDTAPLCKAATERNLGDGRRLERSETAAPDVCVCVDGRLQLKVFPDEGTYHEKLKELLSHGLCTCINRCGACAWCAKTYVLVLDTSCHIFFVLTW